MIDRLTHIFSQQFSTDPDFAIQAPGRVNLIGEHIDYLGGMVMPVAIEPAIYGVGRSNDLNCIRVWTGVTECITSFELDDTNRRTGEEYWLNYLLGVLVGYRDEGIVCTGFDLAIDTELAIGAGLSASAALETLMALAIERVSDTQLDPQKRAELCQRAEHEYARVPCGIMDQLAVGAGVEGHALYIDCQSLAIKPVKLPDHISIVVTDTKVSHSLGDGQYRNRLDDCQSALNLLAGKDWRDIDLAEVESYREKLGDHLFRRARHVVTEMARVEDFLRALKQENYEQIGALFKASHDSLQSDFEVSCAELDLLVDAAYEFGSLGSRMTGGGFGGSTICLVETEAVDELMEHLANRFEQRFASSIQPFVTKAASGASYVKIL